MTLTHWIPPEGLLECKCPIVGDEDNFASSKDYVTCRWCLSDISDRYGNAREKKDETNLRSNNEE